MVEIKDQDDDVTEMAQEIGMDEQFSVVDVTDAGDDDKQDYQEAEESFEEDNIDEDTIDENEDIIDIDATEDNPDEDLEVDDVLSKNLEVLGDNLSSDYED